MIVDEVSVSGLPPLYTQYTYYLRCPITLNIFYVGKTINPETRLSNHIKDSLKPAGSNKDKCNVIKSILDAGLTPIMFLIDKTEVRCEVEKYMADFKEVYWIRFYSGIGCPLTNKINKEGNTYCTDYEMFKRKVSSNNGVFMSHFIYKQDKIGRCIIHGQMLAKFGYQIPKKYTPPPEKEYKYDYVYDDITPFLD